MVAPKLLSPLLDATVARCRADPPGMRSEATTLKSQSGGTFGGLLVGLLLGLAIAVGVALYVAKSPIPFIDKVSKPLERAPTAKSMADAPDPNMSMYPRSRVEKRTEAAGGPTEASGKESSEVDEPNENVTTQEAAGSAAVVPPPAAAPASPATKGTKPAAGSTPSAAASTAPTEAPAKQAAAKTEATAAPGEPGGNYVQAGAFKILSEAEALKARLALLGLESRVVKFDQGGQVFFRVRLGPYPRGEELNRTRNRLLEAGLDAVVVKQP